MQVLDDNQTTLCKTAIALGFFDGLHLGHTEVIKTAVKESEKNGLFPAVFTFAGISKLPKFSNAEMLETEELKQSRLCEMGVKYLYSPDFSFVRELTAEQFVKKIPAEKMNAQVVVCGYDFHFGRGALAGAEELTDLCKPYGINVIVVPPLTADGIVISSSGIREHVRRGEIETANRLLGREFAFYLDVVHGNHMGKTVFNFPTINQHIPAGHVIPRFGVYKSMTVIDGKDMPSVTNIGIKPTIGGQKYPIVETHIIGVDLDLYGQKIKVKLNGFIRPERMFSDLQQLKEQMHIDAEIAAEY